MNSRIPNSPSPDASRAGGPPGAPAALSAPDEPEKRHPRSAGVSHVPARRRRPKFAELPEETRQLIVRMIEEGATCEQVAEAVPQQGTCTVTVEALEGFFRSNGELQQARIRGQVEAAQALLRSFKSPRAASKKLAEAVVMTGLAQVNRGETLSLKDSVRARLEEENLRLRNRILTIRAMAEVDRKNFQRARIRLDLAKWHLAKQRVNKLQKAIQQAKNDPPSLRALGPEALRRIQEIYGIIHEPVGPKAPEEKTTHA